MRLWQIAGAQFQALHAVPADLPAQGFIWVALAREHLPEQLPLLQQHLLRWFDAGLLDLHVSDLLNEQLPSNFDSTRAYDLMVLQRLAASTESEGAPQLDTRALAFVVFERLLISVHPSACAILGHFAERLAHWGEGGSNGGNRLPVSADELMLRMCNHAVDSYLDLRRQLSRQHGELQQALIDTRHPFEDWPALLAARDTLHRLEDLCEDQQSAVQEWLDALAEWPAHEGAGEREGLRVRGRDLLEHIERVLSHVHRLSSSTESAVQMHYAALGHRTNSIMRVLTVITAIFLPLNLITGFFGMNFDALPLIHRSTGIWYAVSAMVTMAVLMGLFFWRKRYLRSR